MANDSRPRLSWVPAFLAALHAGQSIRKAASTAGISASTAQWLRREDAAFARDWEAARAPRAAAPAIATEARRTPHWRKDFIEALAETSNVSASAARANVPVQTVYKLRRDDPEFAARWQTALREGYDNLEIEVLGHLRNPQEGPKLDVGAAVRLLAAHRATVERQRAIRSERDKRALLDSIDKFIDDMRRRRAANTTILIETQADDVAE